MKSSFHGSRQPRILVVEDGLIMARDIERRLQSLGYAVVGLATSGDEAIQVVAQSKPDLVLMDVRLRGALDGIQVAAEIHALADVPVVYVTAHSDDATLARARQTEPFGYVLKPFEEKELRTTIEMALYRHDLYRKMQESEQRYKLVAELTTLFMYGLSLSAEGKIVVERVSDGFTPLTGLPPEALASLDEHVHPYDVMTVRNRIPQWLAGAETLAEYRLRMQGGEFRWVKDQARIIGSRDKKEHLHIIGAVQDLSLQKEAERRTQEAMRTRAECSKEIAVSMEEQAEHIVFVLESHSAPLKAKQGSFEDVVEHVRDVLSVHRTVRGEKSPDKCAVGHHMQTLAAGLFKRFGPARVTYTVDAAPVEVDAQLATNILLITQELLMNCLRHAFPNARKGHVQILLSEEKGKHLTVQVSDDGVGMKKEAEVRKTRSVGFDFVRKLCGEINATVDVEREGGVSVKIVIPT